MSNIEFCDIYDNHICDDFCTTLDAPLDVIDVIIFSRPPSILDVTIFLASPPWATSCDVMFFSQTPPPSA